MDNCTRLEFITDLQRLPDSQAFVALPIPMTADRGGGQEVILMFK